MVDYDLIFNGAGLITANIIQTLQYPFEKAIQQARKSDSTNLHVKHRFPRILVIDDIGYGRYLEKIIVKENTCTCKNCSIDAIKAKGFVKGLLRNAEFILDTKISMQKNQVKLSSGAQYSGIGIIDTLDISNRSKSEFAVQKEDNYFVIEIHDYQGKMVQICDEMYQLLLKTGCIYGKAVEALWHEFST